MVRTEDWSKCRYEQGHLYRFPAQSVSPQKMLAYVNFEIMPCIEYQSVVTFLYCQMLVATEWIPWPVDHRDAFQKWICHFVSPILCFFWAVFWWVELGCCPCLGGSSQTPLQILWRLQKKKKWYARCIASCVASSVCSKAYEKPSEIYSLQAQDPASQINCDHRVHGLLWVTLGESHICLKWEMSGFKYFLDNCDGQIAISIDHCLPEVMYARTFLLANKKYLSS